MSFHDDVSDEALTAWLDERIALLQDEDIRDDIERDAREDREN